MTRAERPRSIRLRLALATAALVAITAALVLAGVYWWTVESLEREADARVQRELTELMEHHARRGQQGLADEIRRRSQRESPGEAVYVLAASSYEAVVGNVPTWPSGLGADTGARTIALDQRVAEVHVRRQVRVASRTLDDGQHLLVGEDVTEQADFEHALRLGVIGALGLAVLFALAAGLAISRNLLGRVEAMNETILRILSGRRSERVALAGSGDEFDALAGHFNRLLDENDRLVDRMREVTNDIAHDLRTPLARMQGHLESALAVPTEVDRSRRTFEELLGETRGVLDTFNALLQISQVESRAVREQMQRVDLVSLVEGAVDLYQPLADEAGIDLVSVFEPDLFVTGNRHLLAQALANLIDNAIKYGGRPGRIEISTRRRGGRVELAVVDGGPGIPASDRERVLERFVRLDASRQLPGTGLGLSFVAAVASLHDARLDLSDAEPGLRVTLSFPDSR